jgi:hypothetical protein
MGHKTYCGIFKKSAQQAGSSQPAQSGVILAGSARAVHNYFHNWQLHSISFANIRPAMPGAETGAKFELGGCAAAAAHGGAVAAWSYAFTRSGQTSRQAA